MTIYERIRPNEISSSDYDKFLSNDRELACEYGFHIGLHNKNKSELVLDEIKYHIVTKEIAEDSEQENCQEIIISCKYPLSVRVDKIIAEQLSLSRSQVKKLYQKGFITDTKKNKSSLKQNSIIAEIKLTTTEAATS
jgi:hypothetical protein